MRVLLLNSYAPPKGGAEEHVAQVRHLLDQAGHDVRFYAPTERSGFRGALDRFDNPQVTTELSTIVDEFAPDVLHVHNFFRTLSAAPFRLADRRSIPILWTAHDFQMVCPRTWGLRSNGEPCERPKLGLCLLGSCRGSLSGLSGRATYAANRLRTSLAARRVARAATTITAPSNELATRLQRELDRAVTHLPYPFPTVLEDPAAARDLDLLFVGRLGPEKGLDRILRALPEVPDLRLTVAGSGPMLTEWTSLARHLGVDDRVDWRGWLDGEALRVLRARHRALVVPSLWLENSPLVVHDALAEGLPVLCSRRGGLPELVEHERNGFVFDPKNQPEIVASLRRLSQLDTETWNTFSTAARARAKDPTGAEFTERLVALYEQARTTRAEVTA
ncbi:MAG: glycosyltransferase [Planctomycetota bacterium]